MKTLAESKSKVFLGDHPVIMQRVLLTSGDAEAVLVAGSVIGSVTAEDSTTTGLHGSVSGMSVVGILAADVTVPASGDAWGDVYVHCEAKAEGLVWADDFSATEQAAAIAAMRGQGIFVK